MNNTPRTNEALAAIFERDGELSEENAPEVLVKLCKVMERERDEALDQLRKAQVQNDHNWQANEMAEQAFRERDRLVEAVKAATVLIAAKGRHHTMLAYEGLRDALQSLTNQNKL